MITAEWVQRQIEETLQNHESRQTVYDLAALYIVRDHLSSFSGMSDAAAYLQKYAASGPEQTKRREDLRIWAQIMKND